MQRTDQERMPDSEKMFSLMTIGLCLKIFLVKNTPFYTNNVSISKIVFFIIFNLRPMNAYIVTYFFPKLNINGLDTSYYFFVNSNLTVHNYD